MKISKIKFTDEYCQKKQIWSRICTSEAIWMKSIIAFSNWTCVQNVQTLLWFFNSSKSFFSNNCLLLAKKLLGLRNMQEKNYCFKIINEHFPLNISGSRLVILQCRCQNHPYAGQAHRRSSSQPRPCYGRSVCTFQVHQSKFGLCPCWRPGYNRKRLC